MKKIFSAAILAAALVFGNQASAVPQTLNFEGRYDFSEMTTGWYAEGIVDPNIDFLALRTGPSVNYPIITRIPPGARVKVYGDRGGPNYNWGTYFVDVTYRGMSGYAHSKYIAVLPRSLGYYP